MLFNHLEEAKKRNALIIVNGDLLCLMNGNYDPRRAKSAVLPEHNGDNYLDLVIQDTAEKLVRHTLIYYRLIKVITKHQYLIEMRQTYYKDS